MNAATSGCYTGFTPSFNSSKCVYVITSSVFWWRADADCRLKTGHSGGLLELRDKETLDFVLTLVTGSLLRISFSLATSYKVPQTLDIL